MGRFHKKSIPMSKHINTGIQGEAAAAEYLERKGYRIVERNYRAGRGEIDLIAWLGDELLVFVEVKTRAGDGFGGPEGAVNAKKQDRMARTAGIYMEQIGYEWAIRFDIVAVFIKDGVLQGFRHVEDAFF
jgi:putative endonuclease